MRSTVKETNPSNGRSGSKSTTYVLEDGTGLVVKGQVNAFYKQPAKTPSIQFPLNGWARVIGVMTRASGFQNSIKVYHIRPVTDSNEIFQHAVEVLSVTLSYSRGITVPPVSLLYYIVAD